MAATIVQSGSYDLTIATGFLIDAFTLDDPVKGLLDSTEFVLDGTTEFASVIDGATGISVFRGRRDIGDQFTAGTMSFDLNDTFTGGIFNPFDTQSPYYDTAQAVPGLAPMRKVVLSREGEELFNGYIVDYNYNFNLGGLDTVSVSCADDFYLLSQTYMDEFNVTEQLASARLVALLALPEVNAFQLPGEQNIETSTITLGGAAAYTVPNGTSVAAYTAKINESVQGRIFIARDGVFTFQDRIGSTLSASVADFHDDGTAIPYDNVGISFEANQVINRASVTHAGATSPEIAEDLASQGVYFIQTTAISDALVHNDTAALDLANYLLVGQPEARYTNVSTLFASLTDAQRDTVAVLEIGNTVTIEKSFSSGNTITSLAQELAIEGIQHEIDLSTGHRITLFTSPTTLVFELILDDAVYGTIDTENVLG
tara:strand:+ start:1525 stop:2808 length:1284 start_codon:yes stop_codon:yes gene_type:complete